MKLPFNWREPRASSGSGTRTLTYLLTQINTFVYLQCNCSSSVQRRRAGADNVVAEW